MAMAAAASSSLASVRPEGRSSSAGGARPGHSHNSVTCRASFPFGGRTISISSPSCSSSRFLSVLSAPSQARSRRSTRIFALDPDFYKIPYVEGVPVGKKLKIWNLPPNTDPQEFRQWFDGLEGVSVESVEFTNDPELNAQGIGGFIEFGTKQEACMAIVRRDGYKFKGKCVRMDFVEKKPHEREIGGRRNRPTYRSSSFSPSNSRGSYSPPSSGSYGGGSSSYGTGATTNANPGFATASSSSPLSSSSSSSSFSPAGSNEQSAFKPYGNAANITANANINSNASMNNPPNFVPTTRSYGVEPSTGSSNPGAGSFGGNKDSLSGSGSGSGVAAGSGSGSYASPPSFGGSSNTVSGYGGGNNAPIPSTPNYGGASTNPSYASPTPSYGSNPSYGSVSSTPGYGNSPPTPSYGNTQPKPSYGNTQSTPSYGTSQAAPSFGNTPGSSGYGQAPIPPYAQINSEKPVDLDNSSLGGANSKFPPPTAGYGAPPVSTPAYGNDGVQSSYGDNKSYGGGTQSRSGYGSMSYGQGVESTPFSGGTEPSSFGGSSNAGFGGNRDSSAGYGAYNSSGTGYGRSEYSQSYGSSEPRSSYGGYGSSPRPSSTNRIFVGNLPWSADDMSLQQLFSEYGSVLEARIVKDRETGRSRGFGFISMSTADEMNAAIQGLDGRQVDGRAIRVNQAESRF